MTRNNSRPPKKPRRRSSPNGVTRNPVRKSQLNAIVLETFTPYFSEMGPKPRYLAQGRCSLQSPDGWLDYTVQFTREKAANRALDLKPGDRIVLIEAHHPDRYGNEIQSPPTYKSMNSRQNPTNLTRRQSRKLHHNKSGRLLSKSFIPIPEGAPFPTRLIPYSEVKNLVQDPETFFREFSRTKRATRSDFPKIRKKVVELALKIQGFYCVIDRKTDIY